MTDCLSNPKTLSDKITTLFLLNQASSLVGNDFTRAKALVISGENPNAAKRLFEAWNTFEEGGISQAGFEARKREVLYPQPQHSAPPSGGGSDRVSQLKELWQMHKDGALSRQEYDQLKAALL
eukprot:TRINITY_DN1143_c1_g1_i1.p1 TRINITY_DN1143_c1_g1~~TRINITY_DN1143_c1_g1_i1.p1  ORF type:complete len:123 (+),score=45.10 TRINITY_DN1143_c1_g1_i1:94-462(+)